MATLALSNYTYAEAFLTTQRWHWIEGHVNAFQYFGGVTEIIVPEYVTRHIFDLMCPPTICSLAEIVLWDCPRTGVDADT